MNETQETLNMRSKDMICEVYIKDAPSTVIFHLLTMNAVATFILHHKAIVLRQRGITITRPMKSATGGIAKHWKLLFW